METFALFSIITLAVVAGNLISLLAFGLYFQHAFKSVEANIDVTTGDSVNES